MHGMIRMDLRLALRILAARPTFSLAVILSLGIGLTATASMFAAVDAVDSQPLPFANADRLASVSEVQKGQHVSFSSSGVSEPLLQELRESAHSFDALAAYRFLGRGWLDGDVIRPLEAIAVSGNLFDLIGARAMLGRGIQPQDTAPGALPVVVLRYDLWRTAFGANPKVIGTTVRLTSGESFLDSPDSARPFTVVGVMPQGFHFFVAQLWTALPSQASGSRNMRDLGVIAHLRPRATFSEAEAEVSAIARRAAAAESATYRGWSATAVPIRDALFQDISEETRGRYVMLAIALSVLLLVTMNVTGLTLTSYQSRQREFALRAALGATQRKIVRPILVECLLCSAIGAACALILAHWTVRVVGGRMSLDVVGVAARLDVRVLIVLAIIAGALACILATGPVLYAARIVSNPALRSRLTGSAVTRSRRRTHDWLMAGEIAVALALLASVNVLATDYARLRYREPGYVARELYMVTAPVPEAQRSHPAAERQFAIRLE